MAIASRRGIWCNVGMPEGCQVTEGAGLFGGRLLVFPELPSTNGWVVDHAAELGHGDVVRAVRQTAGRGRLARTWLAPEDRGLTVSLHFAHPPDGLAAPNVSQAVAVGVRAVLCSYGLDAELKWPNDVLVRDWKIAGLLAEVTGTGGIVVGVGINVNLSDADFAGQTLLQPATSIAIECGAEGSVEAVARDLIGACGEVFAQVASEGFTVIREAWGQADWLSGRLVTVSLDGAAEDTDAVSGRSLGLDADGALQLETEAGGVRTLRSGDVRQVREAQA